MERNEERDRERDRQREIADNPDIIISGAVLFITNLFCHPFVMVAALLSLSLFAVLRPAHLVPAITEPLWHWPLHRHQCTHENANVCCSPNKKNRRSTVSFVALLPLGGIDNNDFM